MSFAARRAQLMDRLRWAPARGAKRQALERALRDLVRTQLERELAAAAERPADNAPSYVRPARRPYWLDQDDEVHP